MTIYPRGFRSPPEPQRDLTIAQSAATQDRVSSTAHRRNSLARMTIALTSGWFASQIALPVYAANLINNSGIQFDQDTTLESNFVESHGAYQSTFGVINLDTKEKTPLLVETRASDAPESIFKASTRRSHLGTNTDFRGTPGNAVPKPVAQYNFKANQRYVLYLESSFNGRPTGILYSTDVLNPNREQQVQFAGGISDLCSSGVTVGWDDTGSKLVRDRQQQDRDFDDFVVQMKSVTCGIGGGETPEVAVAAPELPGVIAPGGGASALWLAPLAALPFLFRGGGDNPGGGGGTPIPPPPGIVPLPGPPPRQPETIPEPFTILGSGSAIAFAALMERRRKKNRK
ncbi:PEP-CTERM sorting domain-containing protein [Leptolyngbya sp. AN03gr2]|uniref:PEP-CTERM sorting domain-containing protein n=1 Tax=unclassified Leptolyngbya TaxID=2650499 RepID=UPI003D31F731